MAPVLWLATAAAPLAAELPQAGASAEGLGLTPGRASGTGPGAPPVSFELRAPAEPPVFRLPRVQRPQAGDAPRLSGGARFLLEGVRVSGALVLDPADIRRVAEPFVGRFVAAPDLEVLRQRLTQLYLDRGYLTSGFVLPDQRVSDGTVRFEAVEGTLTEVVLEGMGEIDGRWLAEGLRQHVDSNDPVALADLRAALARLDANPLVARVSGELLPGERRGESRLRVVVEPADRLDARVSFDNHRSPGVGEHQGRIDLSARHLLSRSDLWRAAHARSQGGYELDLAVEVPLWPDGLSVIAARRQARSRVVAGAFTAIDVRSGFDEYGIGLAYPVLSDPHRSLRLEARLERLESTTYLLGRRFSFSEGVANGASRVTAARLSGTWTERSATRALSVEVAASFGIDALGATVHDARVDGQFVSGRATARYARLLDENGLELIARGEVQFSNDRLLPLEKFAIGGARSVRGYRNNELVRDQGFTASLELAYPLTGTEGAGEGLSARVFFDLGAAWNKEQPTPGPRSLASAGVGLVWTSASGFEVEFYKAFALRNLGRADDSRNESLQGQGIHFQLRYRLGGD